MTDMLMEIGRYLLIGFMYGIAFYFFYDSVRMIIEDCSDSIRERLSSHNKK